MNHPLACSYDSSLVMLSIAIAVFASYVVLDLAERVTSSRGGMRWGWLVGGAVVMGTGIWAMHFVGMLAYQVPVPVEYHTGFVLISVLPSVLAAGLALFLISRPQVNTLRLLGGSMLMGSGIAAMHYVGMMALFVPNATLHYNPLTVVVSVAIAIAASFVALSIAFRFRTENHTFQQWKKIGSALLMGAAVPMTHYLGMAAVTVQAELPGPDAMPHTNKDELLLASAVGLGTLIIISLTLLISFLDRRLFAQTTATQVLQDHQDELQAILHGVRVGVLVIGAKLEIQMMNHAVLDLLGVTKAQLQTAWQESLNSASGPPEAAANPAEAVPAAGTESDVVAILRAIANQQCLQNAVLACVTPNQHHKRWLLVNAVPECSLHGREHKTVCTFSDVTDLKQAEQALQQSEAENRALVELAQAKSQELSLALEELQQAQSQIVHQEKMSSLGQMVAGIAHEINNPVTFIYSNLTHADQYAQDLVNLLRLFQRYPELLTPEIAHEMAAIDLDFIMEDLPKLFRSMQLGADRIREIVSSLRNFSRLDEAAVKAVDLHEGIDSTLLILGHRLKAAPDRPAIQIHKEYGNLPLTECYAGQLNQVFMNVLSNAIDALEDAWKQGFFGAEAEATATLPQIWVQTRDIPTKDAIQVRIVDNGAGMPAQTLQKIFDPFYTTKPVGKGTGLGLFISYQIVERHNGLFRCQSEPGQGTEFVIEIPTHRGQPAGVQGSKKLAPDRPRSPLVSPRSSVL